MKVMEIRYLVKEIVDDEDFYVTGEIYIEPENGSLGYEVFDFEVISIKRLYCNFEDNPIAIMLNRGLIIAKIFDESLIEARIKSIVSRCQHSTDEENYVELSAYFRRMFL